MVVTCDSQTATQGVQAQFDLFIKDAYSNPRPLNDLTGVTVSDGTVSLSSPVALASSVSYVGGNQYTVRFTPTASGVRRLLVRIAGVDISGSPASVYVSP